MVDAVSAGVESSGGVLAGVGGAVAGGGGAVAGGAGLVDGVVGGLAGPLATDGPLVDPVGEGGVAVARSVGSSDPPQLAASSASEHIKTREPRVAIAAQGTAPDPDGPRDLPGLGSEGCPAGPRVSAAPYRPRGAR